MRDIKLTGTLKTYKAFVTQDENSIPEGYTKIGEIEADGEICIIALPRELLTKQELWKRLGNQAMDCLAYAVSDACCIEYGEYF
jgi:hypothetical protein